MTILWIHPGKRHYALAYEHNLQWLTTPVRAVKVMKSHLLLLEEVGVGDVEQVDGVVVEVM